MSEAGSGLLADTHALIWLVTGALSEAAATPMLEAAEANQLLVSPVTAWEIGLLSQDGRPDRPAFDGDADSWYHGIIGRPGVVEAPFTGAIALASTRLPGDFHRDPADRFLVATARAMDVPIITHDRKILAYAEAGYVRAIPC